MPGMQLPPVRVPNFTGMRFRNFIPRIQQGGTPSVAAPYYFPWQFPVSASPYNAAGNGVMFYDGVMSSGNPALACNTTTPFTNASIGDTVVVSSAGGGTYTPLVTTIASYTNSANVTLAANASSNTSGTPGAIGYFGTDDTTPIQHAINDAVSYAQAHNGYAEVLFEPLTYIIGGPAVSGSPTFGNSQLTLPVIPTTTQKVTLVFRGTWEQTGLIYWLQTTPQASGTVLACARNDGTNSIPNGPAAVVGGPYNGYGGQTSLFSNMLPVVDGVSILTPYNGTYGGWNFFGCAEANLPNWGIMAAAVVPASSAPVPTQATPGNITNTWPAGVWMPDVNNNDNCNIGWGSAEGVCIGAVLSEHSYFSSLRMINCVAGMQVGSLSGTSMPHTCGGDHASIENTTSGVVGLGAPSNVFLNRVDLENAGAVFDSNDYLTGITGFGYNGAAAYGNLSVTGGTGLRILDIRQQAGPVASPHSPPASTAAWPNLYYRDAWITVALSGGNTFTSLDIDSTAQPNAAGAGTYSFLLPAGHSYTPTYSAGTLTHTVSLQ